MKITCLLQVHWALLMAACGNPPGGGSPATILGLDYGFLPANAEKGELFRQYRANARSSWSKNWAGALDLTGVAWNDRRTATLISPSHVVMAGHFVRPSDVPVIFHDRHGTPHARWIASVKKLDGVDVAVARLDRPLPPEIRPFDFATAEEAVVGRPVITTDQTMTLSVHRIEAVFGKFIRLSFVEQLDPVYRRNLIKGDSGNPSFLRRPSGELVLLETHTFGGSGSGPFFGSPEVQAAVRAAMAELGE
jgi:hypothetical protein